MAVIENYYSKINTIISGTADNDSIKNFQMNVTVNGEAGNDTIENYYGDNVLINGGDGNDTIENYYGDNVSINGGSGDDTLTGSSCAEIFQYASGDGNDIITNYSGEDTIHIASGQIDNTMFSGNDLVFNIGNGSLTLKNMKNHAITIKDSSGTSTQLYSTGLLPKDVIRKFVQSMANTKLNSRQKLDEAIKACSGFSSLQEVIDKMVADCRKANNAETFLRDYCGIIYDNDDSGSVLGWDMGGMSIKTKSDLLPENSTAISLPTDVNSFTRRGLTLTLSTIDKDTLTTTENLVLQGLYSWWMEDSLKLIEESYGFSFEDKPYSIPFYFVNDDTAFGWAWAGPSLTVNMAYTNFTEDDKTGGGLDGTLAHEFTHVLQCNFNIWSYMPNYMTEGMADITGGGDGYTELAGNADSLAAYLNVDNTFSEDVNVYTVGNLFWYYLSRQAANNYDELKSYSWKDNSVINGTSSSELLTGSGNNQTIDGGAGNDTITAYGNNTEVNGGEGDDYILPGIGAENLTINGGDGNDTVINETSNILIYGGTGADYIKSEADSIKIFTGDGNDTINVNITSTYDWDNSVWINTTHNNATIEGGTGDDSITNHNDNASINGDEGNDTIRNYASIAAINGGDDADYIYNNGFNVTINGGNGDDTIQGSSEYGEIFQYSSGNGNDVITNYSTNDTIHLTSGIIKSSSLDVIDVILNIGEGSIKLKDARNKPIMIVDEMGNVTSKVYKSNNIVFEGTDDDDEIYVYDGSNVTINGGSGNDTIVNGASDATINGGDGNDVITNFNINTSINGDDGADTINNFATNTFINGGINDDLIRSEGDDIKISGSDGNDTIEVNITSTYDWDNSVWINTTHNNATIEGGTGDDSITNHNDNALINGDDGNDKIINYASVTAINGGDGADSIYNSGNYVTINGGTGDDIINIGIGAHYNVINYASGDGKMILFTILIQMIQSISQVVIIQRKKAAMI